MFKKRIKSRIYLDLLHACLASFVLTCAHAQSFPDFGPSSNTPLARRLGWIVDPDVNNLCHGYYLEPSLAAFDQPVMPLGESITSITGDSGMLSQKRVSVLTGNIVVTQSGRKLYADKAYIYRDSKTGKIVAIDLYGHVRLLTPGKLILGRKVHLQINKRSGVVNNVVYRILLARNQTLNLQRLRVGPHHYRIIGLTAWGKATKAVQIKPGLTEFYNATYTTCQPNTSQWRLVASKLKLNKHTGWGEARNARLEVMKFPILYLPYMSFPIDKRRKTGFLFPIIGFSDNYGAELGLPFYWNLAPNYDDTITPRVYTERGFMLENLFRYLTPDSFGHLHFAVLPADQKFKRFKRQSLARFGTSPSLLDQQNLSNLLDDSSTRALFHWDNFTQFTPHLSTQVNFTQVSDDYYFQDLGAIAPVISTNQLLRQGDVEYIGEHWIFSGVVTDYDTLHQINRQPVSNLYSRLPQLNVEANYPDLIGNLDFSLGGQATYFNINRNPGDIVGGPQGGRYILQPGLSYPVNWPWGYFTPTVQYQVTQYNLQRQPNFFQANITRTLPIIDVDSGIFLDRTFNWFGREIGQTLEPRIFYLYVPFHDQNQEPRFDAAFIPFTYEQLFRTNRFSGQDLIGDANQISLAITTRLIDEETGQEKIRLSLGRIYYFHNRKVTFCQQPGCTDFFTGIGATPEDEPWSPWAGEAHFYFNPRWSLNGLMAYDPNAGAMIDSTIYLQYRPGPHYLMNLGYNYVRNGDIISTAPKGSAENNLQQVSYSFIYPLPRGVSAIGIFNYNVSQNHVQTMLAGLEYNTCCWAVRFVGGRTFAALNNIGAPTYTNVFYFQFALKGLANVDPNHTSNLLTTQIRGYVDPFSQYGAI